MTTAVPVPHISASVPCACAAITSWMEMGRSSTATPQSRSNCSTDLRVMPSRMAPLESGGVTTVSPMRSMMFIEPTSSRNSCLMPSRQSTWA